MVSCDKDNGSTQKPTEPTELDAPVVTVTEGTGSLTANWAPVKAQTATDARLHTCQEEGLWMSSRLTSRRPPSLWTH